ncbi:MAG: DUF2110 family protein [Methanocella sp.]|jgi:hypothetical protein
MTQMTLFVRAFNSGQLKQIDDLLQSQFEDLEVKSLLEVDPTSKWVHLSLEGEDEAVAASFARKKIGTVPKNWDAVEVDAELKGYVSKVDESRGQLLVDIGVFQPKVSLAVVSLATLRAQFAAGKESTAKAIAEAYGIAEGLPVTVRVTEKGDSFKAELASGLVEKLKGWQQSLLDRLIILRANKDLVDATLERTHLTRDVIEVEQLGFFEFALTCKLGTEARGLIPRVGRYMRNAVFVVFSAKKSIDFLGQ